MLTDVSITTSLLWQLNRSGFYNHQYLQTKRYLFFYDRHISGRLSIPPSLHRLVAKLSSLAIKTGIVPCVFALANLVTYIVNVAITPFFAYMLGRVYTTTMLYSLIYRDKLYSDGELMNIDSISLPPMTCESNHLFIYFSLPHFSMWRNSLLQFISTIFANPPSGTNGSWVRPGCVFFREINNNCHLSYRCREPVFKPQELRSHII